MESDQLFTNSIIPVTPAMSALPASAISSGFSMTPRMCEGDLNNGIAIVSLSPKSQIPNAHLCTMEEFYNAAQRAAELSTKTAATDALMACLLNVQNIIVQPGEESPPRHSRHIPTTGSTHFTAQCGTGYYD